MYHLYPHGKIIPYAMVEYHIGNVHLKMKIGECVSLKNVSQ